LFLVWFGVGLLSKLAVAFLVAVFPVVMATALGMQAVDPDMVRLFRSMRASRTRTFLKLRVPTALPSIFSGLKVAMTLAVVGALVGEFVGANSGLGYYILLQNGQLDTVAVNAAIVVVTAVGVVLYFAIELLERLVSPHRSRDAGTITGTM
ncbi:MAG: ABC transporter permease subunit, partial [Sporichthyaceae bacterium]|nr:ABC transporter permease subunit [Sporichthyaceae bacterium]